MSLQDDVWDVENALIGTADAKAYARIVKRLWEQETHNTELAEANTTFYKAFKLMRLKCGCGLSKPGFAYCPYCGGSTDGTAK